MIPQEDNLVFWLPGTKGSGSTISDYSGNSNNGTITGGAWKKNTFNGSYNLDLNGSSDKITMPAISGSLLASGFTVSVWVKPDTIGDKEGLIDMRDNSANEVFLFNMKDSSSMYAAVNSGCWGWNAINLPSGANLLDGDWHHLVMVWNTSNITIYYDGVASTSYTCSGAIKTTSITPTIGWDINQSAFYDGDVDNTMLWSSVLTQEEIIKLYKDTYRN